MRNDEKVLEVFFFSSRRRHTRCLSDWSSDVCSSDLPGMHRSEPGHEPLGLARSSRFHPRRSRPAGMLLRPDRGGGPVGQAHSGPDRPRGISQNYRRRRPARLHPDRAGLQLRGGPHVRRTDRASRHASKASPVYHAAHGGQTAKEPRVFRLPANRQIQDHRGALCAPGVRGRPGGDAAGVGRSRARAAPEAVSHPQCPGTIPPKGRPLPRRAGAAAESLRSPPPSGEALPAAYFSVVKNIITPSPRKTRSAGAFFAASPLRVTTRPYTTAQRSYFGLPKRNLPSWVWCVSAANFLLSTAASNSKLAGGLGPSNSSSVSHSTGGAAVAGSQDCSPIQRPSCRNE